MTPLEMKTMFIGLIVGLAQLVSGVAVLFEPNAVHVSPLYLLHEIAQWFGYTNGFVGATLVFTGIMAVIGSHEGMVPRGIRSFLFVPQQVILLVQVASISYVLLSGHYPDGYIPNGGPWFILTDQIWAWVLSVSHSIWLAAFIFKGKAANGRDH